MFKMDENRCPTCESMLDGASAIEGPQGRPAPGDITVCYYCSEILEFTDTMAFSKADITDFTHEMKTGLLAMVESIQAQRPKFH